MSEFFDIPPALWPIKVLQDGFDGKYSGGRWIAYSDDQSGLDDEVWNETQCDAAKAVNYWGVARELIAIGATPDQAVAALLAKLLDR